MRMAVIGCGEMGKLHARKLAKMDDVDLVGVCDTNDIRAEGLAEELGVDAFHDYWEVSGEIDAAVVATNPYSHGPIAEFLLLNDTHVLVEKPLAVTSEVAEHLAELSRENGTVLQVGHIERFNPMFKRIAHTLTYPFEIEAHRFSPVSFRGHEVDVVLDLMIHDIDMVLTLARTDVSRVTGSGDRDTAIAELAFIDGSVAVLRADRKAKTRSRVWKVGDSKHYLIGEHDSLADELRHFIDCVREGRKPDVTGEQGCAALKVALEVSRQVREGA